MNNTQQPASSTIVLSELEWREFSRLATDAYRLGLNTIGTRFSVAAAVRVLTVAKYDALKTEYRSWLVAGFPGLELETLRARQDRGENVAPELEAFAHSMNGKG